MTTAVGSFVGATANGLASLSLTPAAIGDCFLLSIEVNGPAAPSPTLVSGGSCSWQSVTPVFTDTSGDTMQLWLGTATSTSTANATVTYSGSVTSILITLTAIEYSSGLGASTIWSKDDSKNGTLNNSSTTTVTYPTLAPTSGTELYVGYASCANSPSAGSTTGFVYHLDTASNQYIYNLGVSGSVSPTATQAAGISATIGVLITASLPGGGGRRLLPYPSPRRSRGPFPQPGYVQPAIWGPPAATILSTTLAITASSAWSFTNAESVAETLPIVGTSAWSFTNSELVSETLAISPSSAWTFANRETVAETLAITATSVWAFGFGSLLSTTLAISASSVWGFTNAQTAANTLPITATSVWAFTNAQQSATTLPIVGSSAWSFTDAVSGTINITMAITASSSWSFTDTTTVAASGPTGPTVAASTQVLSQATPDTTVIAAATQAGSQATPDTTVVPASTQPITQTNPL